MICSCANVGDPVWEISVIFVFLPATCIHGDVRLAVGEDVDSFYQGLTDYNSAYYDNDRDWSSGRVEVCVSGRYGSVCQTPWTEEDASVVCKQLGLSEYGVYSH